MLVQKGAKLKATDLDGTVTLDYLEVPILGVISLSRQGPVVPFFYVGGSVSANVNATIELNGVETDIPDHDIRRNDIGTVFGGGVYVDSFTLEARYTTGMNSVMTDADHPQDSSFLRNRRIQVTRDVTKKFHVHNKRLSQRCKH